MCPLRTTLAPSSSSYCCLKTVYLMVHVHKCRDQGQLTCLLPFFFCTGVAPPSAREGVPTDLLLPVCTAGEEQAAGLDAEAPGDAFALPCVATLPIEKHVLDGPQVFSSFQVSPKMAKHPISPTRSPGH